MIFDNLNFLTWWWWYFAHFSANIWHHKTPANHESIFHIMIIVADWLATNKDVSLMRSRSPNQLHLCQVKTEYCQKKQKTTTTPGTQQSASASAWVQKCLQLSSPQRWCSTHSSSPSQSPCPCVQGALLVQKSQSRVVPVPFPEPKRLRWCLICESTDFIQNRTRFFM